MTIKYTLLGDHFSNKKVKATFNGRVCARSWYTKKWRPKNNVVLQCLKAFKNLFQLFSNTFTRPIISLDSNPKWLT
jgi:hypothetical protein